MKQIVNLLYNEWDLGKTPSKSKGKICSWIYLFSVLEESKKIIIEYDNNKVIAVCGYSKFDSKLSYKQKIYSIIKNILIIGPLVKDTKALKQYYINYDYTPDNLCNYFDGEITLIILDKNYRKMGIGRKVLEKTFEQARLDGIKNIKILTDESCDYNFYEKMGCKKIYKKIIANIEPNKLRNVTEEIGYIYEKKLISK